MRIVIIGNGIAGSTAARYLRKRTNHEIIMISGETPQPFSRTALMYIYMGHLRYQDTKLYEDFFWPKNRIQLIHDWVTEVDVRQKQITLTKQPPITYDTLILATGSQSNQPPWPGVKLNGVQGLYSWQDLQQLESWSTTTKQAVVVGGGLIGIELAEMLHSRGIHVTLVVREQHYWSNVLPDEEARLIDAHIRAHGIDLRLSTEVKSIEGDKSDRVQQVTLHDGTSIDCQWVGLAVGVRPNLSLAKDLPIECDKGILVDEYLTTSNPDIYAIGDCVQLRHPSTGRKAIEAVWYTGKLMGKTVARSIAGEPTPYRPGIWYNSAKFFDIEYQVYGAIPQQPSLDQTLLWQDPVKNLSIRFHFTSEAPHTLLGINLLGIRMRHNVADKMIGEKWPMEQVMEQVAALLFMPEGARDLTKQLIAAYRKRFPQRDVNPVAKKKLQHLLFPQNAERHG